jgi:hypothetical protein
MEKKNLKIIITIMSIIIILLIIVVIFCNSNKNADIANKDVEENIVVESNIEEYVDKSYGVSFKYNKELDKKESTSGGTELALTVPTNAGCKFFYNSPDTPMLSYNKESEIQKIIYDRKTYVKSQFIKREETTISKVDSIECTLLEFVTGQFTDYVYIIPHRAGIIQMGITFPTGEPIKELNDIIDSFTMN